MKKIFAIGALVIALVLAGCEHSSGDSNSTPRLPSLTIKNESSYTLGDVKFSGISFSSPESKDLLRSTQAVKQLTENDLNKTGYITFVRKDIGIACRTEPISITEDYTFTFLDTSVVEEVGNTSNKSTLSAINFLSKAGIIFGGLTVSRNDIVNIGESVISAFKQAEFTLKNNGSGKLLLIGNEPVKIASESNVFSVVQPASSEIASNSALTFKINFNPNQAQTYTGTVTVSSSDPSGNFTFTITASGVTPKPIVSIFFGAGEITQNGTVDAGEVLITQTKNIEVVIKNTGNELLTVDTANITISGSDAAAFSKLTNPGTNISQGTQSQFTIRCVPIKLGENNAILTIPTNDSSRNPLTVYLKVTGKYGTAVLELSQGATAIANNAITSIGFGQVELGSNKTLAFIIKNTGNIPLNLTGVPMVESSYPVFTISTQPISGTIAPGDSVPFIVRYTPTAEREDDGDITIVNNSASPLFTFKVKGAGYVKKPQITLKQNSTAINAYDEFSFGAVAINEPKVMTFTIENSGDANLTFITVDNNRINLTDNEAGLFAVTYQPSASTVVTPGNTTTFALRFTPTAEGDNFAAWVHIKTNSRTHDEFSFIVKGSGYVRIPQITLKQGAQTVNIHDTISFGDVAVGESKAITFTIGNPGGANLTFETIGNNRINLEGNTDGFFAVTQQPSATAQVLPDSTVPTPTPTTFTVRFAPTRAGEGFAATVRIKTNSRTNDDFSFTVNGGGIVPAPTTLTWFGAWRRNTDGSYTSNSIGSGSSTWETLTITTTSGCRVIVSLTASCYNSSNSAYGGYATGLDAAQSVNAMLRVTGTSSQTYTYTVPAGTHTIHFGYSQGNNSYGNNNVTVAVAVQ